MTDRKELELLIRAQLKGVKDLDSASTKIKEIADAIEAQTKAAKRGDNSIDELKASLEALVLTQRELQGQNSAINYFNKLTAQLSKTEQRVETTTKRYNEYLAKLEEAGTRTDAQQQTLIRYSVAVERANKSLATQRDSLAKIEAEFASAGLAVDKLASVQERNLQLQAELGVVYNRGKESVKSYATEVRNARAAQAELDRSNREAAQSAELFEKAERRAAEAAEARARAAREVAQGRSDRSAEIAAQRRLDAQRVQSAKRAQELADLQKDIVERSAQAALTQQAQAAEKNAKAYTTLARAADNLKPKVASVRDTINEILNPTEKARTSLGGLEKEANDLAASIGKIRGPVRDYKAQVDQLNASQRAIAQQAGLVDNFNRQVASLRQMRQAFTEARAKVAEYAAGVKAGGEGAAQFAQKLAQADAVLRRAAQSYAQQATATRQSRDALRSAGIETQNLVGAMTRLTSVAQTNVGAVRALDQAVERYGQSEARVRNGGGLFRDEGRTTLSYLQRIRGEVLSLVAAYGGLFTVIRTAQGAIDAAQTREGVRNQLSISVGNDRAAIDAEYEYVRGQADRIGVEFDRAVKGYAKFSAAATLAGRSRQEIRSIFEVFSEVGRVANLSADDLDGVFKALEQITSKGKIQAEELRGQLGDRLFGAFQIAAKALKDQFPDLDKALEKGLVTSEQLVAIANEYRKVVADQLPAATQSLAAQQARLNTAVTQFQLAVADSGFIDSYREALITLTEFLRSNDGKEFAEGIGAFFKGLADLFVFLLKNVDALTTAFALFAGMFVYQRLASGIKALDELTAKSNLATGAIDGITKALGFVRAGLQLATAAYAGYQIGTYLYNEFKIVRDAGTYMVTSLLKAWATIKVSYEAAISVFPVVTREVFEKVVSLIKRAAKAMIGVFADLAESVGLDGLGASLRNVESRINTAFSGFGESAGKVKTFRERLAAELAEINRIRDEMLADPGGTPPAPRATATATPVPTKTGKGKSAGLSDKELAKRANEIEAITRALETLDAKIDRSQTDTLQKQLDAIDSQYAALARRIEKLGGQTGTIFMRRLTEAISALRAQTISKFNEDLAKEQEALLKKTESEETQAGRRSHLVLQDRLDAVVTEYKSAYRELAALREKFEANSRDTSELDAIKQRLDAAKAIRLEQEKTKFKTEELQRLEQLLNDTIAARDKLLAAVNTQREVGNIDDVQAAEQLNAIQDQYVPKIQAAYEATRLWAVENAKIFANEEQRQVFLATLDAIQAKATGVKTEFSLLNKTIIQGGVNAVNTGLNVIADGLQNIVTGQQSVGEGFRGMLVAAGQFAASFLRDIALMIIKMQIFKAMQGSGNPYLAAAGTAGLAGMGVKHGGGVIGHYNQGNRTRNVSPAWFENAPRYHNGGVMGLASDEYATILQRGEEVLAADSPRNIMNGGGLATPGGNEAGNRFVLVDDRSRIPEAMNSPDGEKVTMVHLRANIATLKQWLK